MLNTQSLLLLYKTYKHLFEIIVMIKKEKKKYIKFDMIFCIVKIIYYLFSFFRSPTSSQNLIIILYLS